LNSICKFDVYWDENRLLRKEDFNNDAKTAGDIGAAIPSPRFTSSCRPACDTTASIPQIPIDACLGASAEAPRSMRYKEPESETRSCSPTP